MKKIVIALSLMTLFNIGDATAQTKKPVKKATTAKKVTKTTKNVANPLAKKGFKVTPNGVFYKIFPANTNGKRVTENDIVSMHVKYYMGDTMVISTRNMNHNQAVEQQVKAPTFKGDMTEGLLLMSSGDSAVFLVPLDTLELRTGQKRPAFVSPKAEYAKWEIKMESAMSQEQYKAAKELKANAQKLEEDKMLQDYFKANNLNPTKTASGLYILHKEIGNGGSPSTGDNVTMNYTGMLLNGKKFDSNVDPAFNHVSPFEFPIGKGRVIKGWDEGVATLQKGGKATLYIPSHLGYGAQGAGNDIPPNAILIFDVEMVDFKPAK